MFFSSVWGLLPTSTLFMKMFHYCFKTLSWMYELYNLCDVNETVLKSFAHVSFFRLRFNWTASQFGTQPFSVTRPEVAHHLDASQVHSIFNFESCFQKIADKNSTLSLCHNLAQVFRHHVVLKLPSRPDLPSLPVWLEPRLPLPLFPSPPLWVSSSFKGSFLPLMLRPTEKVLESNLCRTDLIPPLQISVHLVVFAKSGK